MPSFDKVRWLAVPLGVYVALTIVLPAANGAAHSMEFVRHSLLVLAGCAAILAIAMLAGVVFEVVFRRGGSS
jgi:hypothetical protein